MRGLGAAFVVLVGLTALSHVLVAGWVWHVRAMLDGYLYGSVSEPEIDRTLALSVLIDIPVVGLYLATGVVFIVWLWRVRSNADLVGPHGHRFRKSWAIWGWLPIVNLWIPRRYTLDVWQVSRPAHELDRSHSEVNWWWALFLTSEVLERIAGRILVHGETLEAFTNGAVLATVAALLGVPAAALAVVVVRRIGDWQSTPGFLAPVEALSQPWVGLTPVDLHRPPPPLVSPPPDDPRWQRPE
ncbi:DUF4328 domain-containing protein [Saccharothrix isguenensis]